MIDVLGHRLLIRPDKLEDTDDMYKQAKRIGLEIVNEEKTREQAAVDRGIVIQVGQSAFKDYGTDPWCEAGDYIAYARYSGKFIKDPFSDEELLIINDEDCVCRFKDESKENK